MEREIRMSTKSEYYKRIKGILFFAKQTFLNEDGREIVPTLESLVEFEKKLNSIVNELKKLEGELLKTWGT